ncbi:folate family ECF transporter S component [Thermoanaerobacterium sp. DL9XJH110]|uniref:folate family ECF transporter S component n=1 Tax=Thermoanaerobacterium sp. DL9XJH110 TaxID=3386643 RepID=UPI003BB7ADEA
MSKIDTRKLTYMAMFVVLNIILTRVASLRIAIGGVEAVRIGFGGYPIILSGILLGPAAGGIVGAVGDLVGYGINPMGPYMPHFTLTAALTGIIPGLAIKIFKNDEPSLWQIFLAIAAGQIITSILLVPYFLYRLFGIPLVYKMTTAALNQSFNIPIYTAFTRVLMRRIDLRPALSKSRL